MVFLAAADPLTAQLGGGSGFNWWQSVGGLVLVFGLLILSLRLLGRFNRRHNPGQTSLLTVWHLGPKREIQVLRLADEVHYIYRHEGAMVLLKQESYQEWERFRSTLPEKAQDGGLGGFLQGKLPLKALAGPAYRRTGPLPARVGDLLQTPRS